MQHSIVAPAEPANRASDPTPRRAAIARQRARAAEHLYMTGHRAEALRLLLRAFGESLQALIGRHDEQAGGGPDVVALAARLRERGLSETTAGSVVATHLRTLELSIPAVESEIAPAHLALYRDLLAAYQQLERAERASSIVRRARWWWLAAAALIGGAAAVLRPWEDVLVIASAVHMNSPEYRPANVVDGDSTTQWRLPPGETGWVEIRLPDVERVDRVVIQNARGAAAARDYTIELYRGARKLRAFDGRFSGASVEQATRTDDVDRIRLVVRSPAAAGIGEIEWD